MSTVWETFMTLIGFSLQGVDKADNDRESRHENGNTSFEEMSLPGAEPVSDKQTV